MKNPKHILSLLAWLVCCSMLNAQLKSEKEWRVKAEEIPTKAKSFLAGLPLNHKVKWYKEQNFDTLTLEAKTKWKKQKYSIEFDTLGNVLDIEIEKKFKTLNSGLQSAISDTLNVFYLKHKVIKVQVQYTGNQETLRTLLEEGHSSAPYTTRYELVVRGKTDEKHRLDEWVFLPNGTLISRYEIVHHTTENLEY